jgi:ferrous iron transport protein A
VAVKTLEKLPEGGAGRVIRIAECPIKPRLEGLGISEGASIAALFSAPSGDPTAYSVRGSVVAVRRSDAQSILVEEGAWD